MFKNDDSHFSFLRCINHEKGERSKEKLGLPKGTALQFDYFFIIGAAIEFPANFAARHSKVDGGRLTTNSKVAYFCLSVCVSTCSECSLLESVRCSTSMPTVRRSEAGHSRTRVWLTPVCV